MDHNEDGAGPLIRAVIESTGRTQRWTADTAGIPHTTFHRKLNGDTDFKLREIRRIARALGVKPSALVPEDFREADAAVAA